MKQFIAISVTSLLLCCMLTACGQSGRLYLPPPDSNNTHSQETHE